MNDGLTEQKRHDIITILAKNPRVERVILFGSRALGTFTLTSDIDLALLGDTLTLNDQAELAEALDLLSIPQRVDLVRFHIIDHENLRVHIKQHGSEWFNRNAAITGSHHA